jgi:hypothetical protein
MSAIDEFVGSAGDYCPHECPNCGGPAYIGGPLYPAKCIEKDCVFYDEDTWVGWLMRLDDSGDPPPGCTEPDFFALDDEPTNPGFGTPRVWNAVTSTKTWGNYLDTYGAVLGKTRKPGESDDDFYTRLLSTWNTP